MAAIIGTLVAAIRIALGMSSLHCTRAVIIPSLMVITITAISANVAPLKICIKVMRQRVSITHSII